MPGYWSGGYPPWMGWMAGVGMLLGAGVVLFGLYLAWRWVKACEDRTRQK